MRTFLATSIILALCTVSQAREELLVVTDPWPPYIIEENGRPSGLEYEITEAVFGRMGFSMRFRSYQSPCNPRRDGGGR